MMFSTFSTYRTVYVGIMLSATKEHPSLTIGVR